MLWLPCAGLRSSASERASLAARAHDMTVQRLAARQAQVLRLLRLEEMAGSQPRADALRAMALGRWPTALHWSLAAVLKREPSQDEVTRWGAAVQRAGRYYFGRRHRALELLQEAAWGRGAGLRSVGD